MAKILCLDLGDQWVGTAISDALRVTSRPYKTVTIDQLIDFLGQVAEKERIKTIVVGNPITMKGGKSQQTEKVKKTFEELQKQFPHIAWFLWDERLSSKRADRLKQARTKEEKIESHSRAAAFILQSYLDFLALSS